ncbi:Cytochrome P450 3A24 [Trametes pubescens]|uniref:Cytochrome P450 3A24 n=1 Tax=Trametes pubescens TaxID=154538 RepID=A0A1M2VNQ3_TRAPU|nr:Cytochrome P450 3A24 [Trametes pubescens]
MSIDAFGPGMISSIGEAHSKQRKLINPVFSSKNLQRVTPVLYEVIHRLTRGIRTLVKDGTAEVDVGRYMGRTALELISRAVIGRSLDPLTETKSHPYAEGLKTIFPAIYSLSNYFQFYGVLRPFIPSPLRRPLMNMLPSRRVKGLLQSIDTIYANAVTIYVEKKRDVESTDQVSEIEEAPGRARDLISILLYANARASEGDTLSEEELIASLSTLIFAATDTTSNALSRVFDCIVKRPDVQTKLREEIMAAKQVHSGGDLSYDELLALPYLDAVLRETLLTRPAPFDFANSTLPLSKPVRGTDGTFMHSIFVPKGTLVFVPVHAANTNPALWGRDARQWRPERWLAPLPDALTEAKIPGVYSHLMTFWGGGRACIGFKFAELEMKIVLAELLSAFTFEDAGKPVAWNIGEVVYPTVGQDSPVPAFPMKVTAL